MFAPQCLQTPQERGFATRRVLELPHDHAGEVGPHLAALVILVILARTSGGVTINWCTPLQHLTAIAPTLCLPCALAEATRALPAPNTAAAARAEMARPAGPWTARLYCHPHSSGRGHAPCHGGRAVATIGNNSIGDSHGIAQGRRAGSGPRDHDDAPSAIKTAAGQRGTGNAKGGENQDTGLDTETERYERKRSENQTDTRGTSSCLSQPCELPSVPDLPPMKSTLSRIGA